MRGTSPHYTEKFQISIDEWCYKSYLDWCMCYVMLHHLQLEAAQVSESFQRDFWFFLISVPCPNGQELWKTLSLSVTAGCPEKNVSRINRGISKNKLIEWKVPAIFQSWSNAAVRRFEFNDPSNGFCPRAQVLMACSFSPTGIIALSSTIIRLT